MKEKIAFYYQKLSLIQKLSIPLLMASLFGFILTLLIVKQVQLIDENTIFLKDELIPTLEKANNNLVLLKKISEKLTFATLAGEEEMLSQIDEHKVIENNLIKILKNQNLHFDNLEMYLILFEDYFKVAKTYGLRIIESNSLQEEEGAVAQELLSKYNVLKKYFAQLKQDVEAEISHQAALNHTLLLEVVYYTITFIIVFAVVIFFTSFINYKDFNDYDLIAAQRQELERINQNLQSSIEYAFLLQEAILPLRETLNRYTNDNFVLWKQRDAVGGDIYFVVELKSKKEILIMVIDGVGHGVAGAFLTMLVKAIETQVVGLINQGILAPSPAKVLSYFNKTIKSMLHQEKTVKANTGFDGGILYYNRVTNTCKYAGAKTALYIINDNELEVIKSDRSSVGFVRTKVDQVYTEHEIVINKGTKLYIATDGIVDQEGEGNSRYGKKRFQALLLRNNNRPFHEQKKLMKKSLSAFKSECEQSDDITVLGIEFI